MNEIYTMNAWNQDKDFRADPGQEITEEVYENLLNIGPPLSLPRKAASRALSEYRLPIAAGFMLGEPAKDSPEGRAMYAAFGMYHCRGGARYYYLGLSERDPVLDGIYYYLECMEALGDNNLFPGDTFRDDRDAVLMAADYEATLYRIQYKGGILVSKEKLYQPPYF